MNQQTIGNDLADQLFDAEQAIDAALAKAARLVDSMVLARGQLSLSAAAGHGAIRRVTGAISSLGEVRGQMVAAHADLEQLGGKLGVAITAGGGGGKPDGVPEGDPFMHKDASTRTDA